MIARQESISVNSPGRISNAQGLRASDAPPEAERDGDGGEGVSVSAEGREKSLATRRRSREEKKEQIPAALLKHKGNIDRACSACDTSRTQFFAWRNEDPEFKKVTDDARETAWETVKDDLESLLIDIAHGKAKGNVGAACAVLNARAKDRGYGSSRQEVTGAEGRILTIKVVYEDQKTEPEHGS
ncbi:MAG TPA: hypothetical protein VJ553_05480 [Candidatus Paceibacterota bacterium]|nr:hypothetical protein [Candidatus Paceibacterota bacterium]